MVDGAFDDYNKILKQGTPGRKHRAQPKASQAPTRRSSRNVAAAGESHGTINVHHAPLVDAVLPEMKVKIAKSTRSQESATKDFRKTWDDEVGNKLFDVKSDQIIKSQVKAGYCFDLDFYEDQKTIRSKVMRTGKVTEEFLEEEKQRKNTLSRQYLRSLSLRLACRMRR